ncbi:hypothetical protein WHT83_02585 [Aminobacter sp. P9b]|uniref:hypothetical protein n=1 Tax=Aminobacter sp. P9b TaxID=3133697 RepID=UPI00324C03E6
MTTQAPTRFVPEWPFPEPSTGELLGYLENPNFAIAFALSKLPDYETASFLRDWRDHKSLKPWLDAIEQDRRQVAGEPE